MGKEETPTRKHKIIRVATVPQSLDLLLKGQLHYLSNHFDVVGLSSYGNELKKIEQREKIRTLTVPMQRKISPFKDIVSLVRLYLVFRKERPTLVHSITPKAGLLSMLASCCAGVPVRLHTFTGLIFPYRTGFLHLLLKNMDRLICACATKVYPEGQGVKAHLEQYKITKKTLSVIGNGNVNGVDTQHFAPNAITLETKTDIRQSLHIGQQDIVFVFVGRIVADKGVNEMVSAFEKLHQTISNIKLILVGDYEPNLDPLLPNVHTKIQEHEHISHVGFQEDIRPFLAISHVLILPSYREGFPNTPIQAGAMGLPCIVSDISGCNEIIHDGVNGAIIPPKDETALYTAMQNLSEDQAKREKYANAARPLIEQRYKQEFVWQEMLTEYKHLVEIKQA